MSYIKQNFKDGQRLYAKHLNAIEKGIVDNEAQTATNTKRITNLEKGLVDDELFVTEKGAEKERFVIPVPANCCPYAELKKVSSSVFGRNADGTTIWNYMPANVNDNAPLDKIKVIGSNILDLSKCKFSSIATGDTASTAERANVSVETTEEGSAVSLSSALAGYTVKMYLDDLPLYCDAGSGNMTLYVTHGQQTVTEGWNGSPITLHLEKSGTSKDIECPAGTTKIENFSVMTGMKPVYLSFSEDVHNLQISFAPPATTSIFEGTDYGGNYTVYTPYKETIIEIPEEIKAMENYGNCIFNAIYDYTYYAIDFENKKLVKVVYDGTAYTTTEEADLSEYLKGDNFIEVETGGCICFCDDIGIQWAFAEIVYQLKETA